MKTITAFVSIFLLIFLLTVDSKKPKREIVEKDENEDDEETEKLDSVINRHDLRDDDSRDYTTEDPLEYQQRDAIPMITSESIPVYSMMTLRDKVKNNAYFNAIDKLKITKSDLVLEIGTGTGLYSMFVAQNYNPKHMVTCEKNKDIYALTEEVFNKNGFTIDYNGNQLGDSSKKWIRYINKDSRYLQVKDDMLNQRADVLITDLTGSRFLTQEMIPSILDAKMRLLNPDARILPKSGIVITQLIQSSFGFCPDGKDSFVEGFDMYPFNRYRISDDIYFNYTVHDHKNMTNPFVAVKFNFMEDPSDSSSNSTGTFTGTKNSYNIVITENGVINAIAMWWRLELWDGVYLSNMDSGVSSWNHVLMMLDGDLSVKKKDVIVFSSVHNTTHMSFQLGKQNMAELIL